MSLCAAVVFLCSAAPLLLEAASTCQIVPRPGHAVGQCPVNMTSVLSDASRGMYTVTLRVWMNADDLCNFPKIQNSEKETLKPTLKKCHCVREVDCRSGFNERRVRCSRKARNNHLALWELEDEFGEFEAGREIFVTYNTTATSCTVRHTVPDPVPAFQVSVNRSSKTLSVTVEPEKEVFVRWCYKTPWVCRSNSSQLIRTSQSALLFLPHLLPCICVQVYYTYPGARRRENCPFKNDNILDVGEVWRASKVAQYQRRLEWSSPCPANDLNISASLCWMQDGHCTPIPNSTLENSYGPPLKFNTTAVDRHPQMCVQFSLQKSHNIYCPFKSDTPTWEVTIAPGRRSLLVFLTSSAPAKFSAQLCVLSERGCTPTRPAQSMTMRNTTEMEMNMPLHIFAEQPCVQVWQSDPALQGCRIFCLDNVHNRRGLYAVAALVFVAVVVILGIFIQSVVKSGAAGWLHFQRPLLLVCSSDHSAHVSAVCALASILQEELGASVHTSLWAQSSQTHAGTNVADLGPLPWLYGQWEAVSEAQGKVLIIWSPEAKKSFEKWKEERANVDKDEEKMEYQRKAGAGRLEKTGVVERGDWKPSRKILGKCKKDKTADDCNDLWELKEPSTVIEPVFMASLFCLDRALQKCKGQRAAIVYFQGLGHSRDIPKALRGVPRYCLPQDFRGLIQELGAVKTQTKASKFTMHCWPRLLSKVLSIYLARQLARRLQAVLPWTQGASVSLPVKITTGRTAGRLRLPLAAGPETQPEQEPLHESQQEL